MAHKTLFLHGFGEDVRVWADFLPHFSWPYDVICPDYASWTACATMADYARQLVSMLEDADTFSIVGHSMGGYIALEIARLYSDRVRTVIMLHSTLFADSAEKKLNRDKTIAFLRQHGSSKFLQSFVSQLFAPVFVKQNSGLMKDLQQRYRDLAVDGLIASTSAMRDRHDFESFIRQTNIPFLFILGEKDPLIPVKLIVDVLATIPQHKFVILPGVGHQGNYEAPADCHQQICSFLNQMHV